MLQNPTKSTLFLWQKNMLLIFNSIGLSYIMYFALIIYTTGNVNYKKTRIKIQLMRGCYTALQHFSWPPPGYDHFKIPTYENL